MANPLIDTELLIAKAIYMEEVGCSLSECGIAWPMLSPETKERYYQMAREHLKRTAVLVPVDSVFTIGQHVEKVSGYRFPGIVIGVAQKLDGKLLYLVECVATGAEGMCHIYSASQLCRHGERP